MKLFEYVAILHPTEDEKKAGVKSSLIVPITPALAKDAEQATLLAARAIPPEYIDRLEQIEVAVRPF